MPPAPGWRFTTGGYNLLYFFQAPGKDRRCSPSLLVVLTSATLRCQHRHHLEAAASRSGSNGSFGWLWDLLLAMHRRRTSPRMRTLAVVFAMSGLVLADDEFRQKVQIVKTEHVDFPSRGAVRLKNSTGELTME